MKIICLVLGLLVTTTLAEAEDAASIISQYRRAHTGCQRSGLTLS